MWLRALCTQLDGNRPDADRSLIWGAETVRKPANVLMRVHVPVLDQL